MVTYLHIVVFVDIGLPRFQSRLSLEGLEYLYLCEKIRTQWLESEAAYRSYKS